MKQIKFRDTENDIVYGGIRLDNGDVICACRGCLIPKNEQTIEQGFELLEEYDEWLDLTEYITGE